MTNHVQLTPDNSNYSNQNWFPHASRIWKVQKIAAVVRNFAFILITTYSLFVLFCQSSFITESRTACVFIALYSFPTPLFDYLLWTPTNSNLFWFPLKVQVIASRLYTRAIDYNLNLVKNYCNWPNIGHVPTPQGTDLYISRFDFRRQLGRVVSASDSQSGGSGFESCSGHLLDLFCYVVFELFVSKYLSEVPVA